MVLVPSKYRVPRTKYTSGGMGCTWPLRSGAVRLRELFDRSVPCGRPEEGEGCVEDFVLAFDVVGCAHRASEGVSDGQYPGEFHLFGAVSKSLGHDRHRWDAGFLDRPCDVSDRHVAHRSDGDEEHQIDILCPYPFQPPWEFAAQPAVGCCSRVRIERWCQRADPAISVGLTQSVDG